MEINKEKQVNVANEKTKSLEPPPVYKFVPEAYAALGAYLLTRPIREVGPLYAAFYEHGKVDPFYTEESINRLIDYLMGCPLGEVKSIVDMLQKGGINQYVAKAEPIASEAQPEPEHESQQVTE